MKYCYECGTGLVQRKLDGEGIIPYCESCGEYRFPIFSAAVSMIVQNCDKTKILLIQQYGKRDNILVAGYINKGESAEQAVVREIREEIGLDVISMKFNKSAYFEKSNTLMLNFSCIVNSESLSGLNTGEVDTAKWFTPDRAREEIKPGSLARCFLINYLDSNKTS